MKYKVIIMPFVTVLFIFQSCNSKKNEGLLIAGEKFKLWEIIKGSPPNSKATYYYCFMNGGRFKIYEKYYHSNKIVEYSGFDVYYERTWKLKNDSLVNIAGVDYKIIQCSYNTLKIYNSAFKNVEMVYSKQSVLQK